MLTSVLGQFATYMDEVIYCFLLVIVLFFVCLFICHFHRHYFLDYFCQCFIRFSFLYCAIHSSGFCLSVSYSPHLFSYCTRKVLN